MCVVNLRCGLLQVQYKYYKNNTEKNKSKIKMREGEIVKSKTLMKVQQSGEGWKRKRNSIWCAEIGFNRYNGFLILALC